MKKIVFFVFVFLMSVFTSFGQDRINESTYSFKNKSNLITNITGWCFNKQEGQWFGNANCIRGEKVNYTHDKRFCTNIKSIQIKTFEDNGVTNYVLIIAYNGGHYTYPSIYEDWNDYIEYQVYSLTKDEYENGQATASPILLKKDSFSNVNLLRGKDLCQWSGFDGFLEDKEVTKLLKECQNISYELYLCVLIALSTGARYSEIVNLTWKNIDLEQLASLLNNKMRTIDDSFTEEIEYIRGMLDLVLFCNLIDTRKHTDFKNKLNAKAEALLKQEREERKRKAEERKRKTAEK